MADFLISNSIKFPQLESFNVKINFQKHKRVACFGIFLTCSTAATLTSLAPILSPGGYSNVSFQLCLRFFFSHFTKLFFTCQFVLASSVIRNRFNLLNDYLKSNKCQPMAIMRDLKIVEVYHKLCDGIEVTNNCFTFSLVIIFGFVLVSEISNST